MHKINLNQVYVSVGYWYKRNKKNRNKNVFSHCFLCYSYLLY